MAPSDYLRFLAALVFVLGLIGVLAWLARRTKLGGRPGGSAGRRLVLVEVLPLDARHRLALVRRDGVEHLLLLGQGADCAVETGILAEAPTPPGQTPARRHMPQGRAEAPAPRPRTAGPDQRGAP